MRFDEPGDTPSSQEPDVASIVREQPSAPIRESVARRVRLPRRTIESAHAVCRT